MTPTTAAPPVLPPRTLSRLQAVAEETRFAIVRLLASGERCVCEIQDELGAAQSRLSFHLKKLRDAGVLADRRVGRWVFYSLQPGVLEEMAGVLHGLGVQAREAPPGPTCPPDTPCC